MNKYQTFVSFIREKSERGSIDSLLETTPSKLILLFPELRSISFARVNKESGIVNFTGFAGSQEPWSLDRARDLFTFNPGTPIKEVINEFKKSILEKRGSTDYSDLEILPLTGPANNLEGFFLLTVTGEKPYTEELVREVTGLIDFLGLNIENVKLREEVKDLRSHMDLLEVKIAEDGADPDTEMLDYVNEIQRLTGRFFGSKISVLFKKERDTLVFVSSSDEAKPYLSFDTATGSFKLFLMDGERGKLDKVKTRDYYREKIKEHLGRIFKEGSFNDLITIPVSVTRKDLYIQAIFFMHADEGKIAFLMELAESLESLILEAGEVKLTRNALRSAAEELIAEKNRKAKLLQMTDIISSTLSSDHSMNLAVSKVRDHFEADICAVITKVGEKEEGVVSFISSSNPEISLELGRILRVDDYPNLSFPYQEKKPLVIDEPGSLDMSPRERSLFSALNLEHLMMTPIIQHGEFIGVLAIGRCEGKKKFSENDQGFAAAVSNQMSSSISNARLFHDVMKSKTEWETIFNSIADGIFIIDRGYRIQSFNDMFAEKHNLKPEDIAGKKCHDLFRCDRADSNECDHVKCVRVKEPVQTSYKESVIPGTFKVTISPIIDENGEVEKTVHLLSDITKEVEYEKKIKESLSEAQNVSSYMETLIESSPDSIISTNVNGEIEYFNRGASELLGYEPEEIKGQHVSIVYPSLDEAKAVGAAMSSGGGVVRNFNTHLRKKDGSLIEAILSVSSIFDGKGKKIGTVGFSKDISRIKKMEDQLRQAEKLTSLGQLASGIAHDFNNILAAISMRTELLKMKTSQEEILSELNIIEKAAIKGSDTVNKLKSFYRTEQKEFHPIDINQVISDAVEITSPRWKDMSQSKGIETEIDLDLADSVSPIGGNEGELKDMFINLIINSLDAMPEGGRIKVETYRLGESMRMVFSDSGMGMSPDIKEKVFEPFFSTKGDMGSGLGLSTVYGIVSSHGGHVDLDSEQGRGTTFTIDFPTISDDVVQEVVVDEDTTANLEGTTVIIFEDENPIRESIKELLLSKGCKVHDFGSSREGLSFMEKDLPPTSMGESIVVITDLGMPEVNGYEIAKRTKELSGQIPVIMITGWGKIMDSRQDTRGDVDRVLSKPLRSSDLFRAIEEVSGN